MDCDAAQHRHRVDAGLAHTLVSEGLHDQAFLARYCTGFERFLPYLMGETMASPRTPIGRRRSPGSAETIRSLARRWRRTAP